MLCCRRPRGQVPHTAGTNAAFYFVKVVPRSEGAGLKCFPAWDVGRRVTALLPSKCRLWLRLHVVAAHNASTHPSRQNAQQDACLDAARVNSAGLGCSPAHSHMGNRLRGQGGHGIAGAMPSAVLSSRTHGNTCWCNHTLTPLGDPNNGGWCVWQCTRASAPRVPPATASRWHPPPPSTHAPRACALLGAGAQ